MTPPLVAASLRAPADRLPGEAVTADRCALLSLQGPARHVPPPALRPLRVMEGPVEVAAEEPAPTGRGLTGSSGGSGGGEVRRVAVSASVVWEKAGPEEAEAAVGEGE